VREQVIMQRVMLTAGRLGWRVYRNNVGVLTDKRGVPVRYGLCPGSADLVGWRRMVITPEMVGTTIAQFVALEVKTERGRLSDEQARWLASLEADGGHALVVRDPQDL
jgi:hypothetical protein